MQCVCACENVITNVKGMLMWMQVCLSFTEDAFYSLNITFSLGLKQLTALLFLIQMLVKTRMNKFNLIKSSLLYNNFVWNYPGKVVHYTCFYFMYIPLFQHTVELFCKTYCILQACLQTVSCLYLSVEFSVVITSWIHIDEGDNCVVWRIQVFHFCVGLSWK